MDIVHLNQKQLAARWRRSEASVSSAGAARESFPSP